MQSIQEEGNIGERILQLVNHFCQGNKTAFGRAAGIQSGVLAGIVGGRESKPGFEILQKMLTAYPSVSAQWLIFGRGPMILGDDVQPKIPVLAKNIDKHTDKETVTRFLMQIFSIAERLKKSFDENAKQKLAVSDLHLMEVYTVADKSPARNERKQLSARLSISEQEAERLVMTKEIQARKISDVEGYRVTEQRVREYLENITDISQLS